MKKYIIALLLALSLCGGGAYAQSNTKYNIEAADLGLDYGNHTGLPGGRTGQGPSLPGVIANIINVFVGLLGIILVCYILYGGWMYMTAGGDDDKVAAAKTIILRSIIGIIIVLSAFAITNFVLRQAITVIT